MLIEGKVVLVTGSNRGIGRACVDELITRGAAKVYATARDVSSLISLVQKHGDKVVPVALDVTDVDQVNALAGIAGDVEVVVSNAGYAGQADLFADDLGPARQEFEVNYWGTLNVARALVPVLESNGGGTFINLVSIAGLGNFPLLPTYSDTKAAVHSLTQGLRLLKGASIQVVGVYPGPVDTDMAEKIESEKASPERVVVEILDAVEAGKTEVFPGPMAKGYAGLYEAGTRAIELQTAAMLAEGN